VGKKELFKNCACQCARKPRISSKSRISQRACFFEFSGAPAVITVEPHYSSLTLLLRISLDQDFPESIFSHAGANSSPGNPAPGGNPGLKRTWIGAIF
jgi:hypothetical protein